MTHLIAALSDIVGPGQVLVDADMKAPYERDWTRRWGGASLAVIRPGSTDEVAAVLRVTGDAGVVVVPQGGNTGLVGGGVPGRAPRPPGAPVILSTARLNRLDPVDQLAGQVTAGAGVTLEAVQVAAGAAGFSFAVDLAARGSATVGGMVATNAGGLHVLRYGSMRAQVVGLEAVFADGQVISRLGGLIKDNSGYDLSQLLVGSEGTLGIVTAARLRLVPALPERVVALIGLPGTAAALAVLPTLRARAEGLEAVEIFYPEGLDLVCAYAGLAAPLARRWPAYLTVECRGRADPTEALFGVLADLDLPEDATAVASDAAGMNRLWAYRERHTEAISNMGVPHKLDITMRLDRLAHFETAVRRTVAAVAPSATLFLFGHVGDGNMHVNVVGPADDDDRVDDAVLRLVAAMDGSISAEHGIGRAKVDWLHLVRSPAELQAMRRLKTAFDPGDLLNPGVLLPPRDRTGSDQAG